MEDLDLLQTTAEQQGSAIDFFKFLRGFWKRKIIIVLLALIFAAYFYKQSQKEIPIYNASVTIKMRELDKESESILSRDVLIDMKSRTFAEKVCARMGLALSLPVGTIWDNGIFSDFSTTSKPIEGKYRLKLDETGLYNLYKVDDKTKSESLLDSCNVWDTVVSERSVNGFSFRLKPEFIQSSSETSFYIKPFERAVRDLNNSVKIAFGKSAPIMILTMVGIDQETIADRLNKIAQIYVEETLNMKEYNISADRRILDTRMETARKYLQEAESALRAFKERYPLSLENEKSKIANSLEQTGSNLRILPLQRQQLTELLTRLESVAAGTDPEQYRRYIIYEIANFAPMSDDPTLAVLRGQLRAQEEEYQRLAGQYTDAYPEAQVKLGAIRQTQNDIIAFASKFRSTLAERENENRARLAQVQAQQRQIPAEEEILAKLEFEKKIREDNYSDLLKQINRLEITGRVEDEQIGILDPAIRPSAPANPSQKQKVLLGGVMGLVLGLALSAGLDFLDKSLRTVTEIEKHMKLPVIGAIPVVDFKDIPEFHDHEKAKHIDKQLVTHDYSPTPIGEAYRALRTQLLFSKSREPVHTLVVTSIAPEEGKSFTSSNLAIIFAQQRTNTLLVDADLRRGVLHNTFHMKKEPGLTNFLSGSVTLTSIVQLTNVPNLSFISFGSLIPNPSELLGSLQMKRFLEEVKRKFDLILFDTPPLDAATDSVVLGTQVDAVAIVVRYGKTNRDLAKEKLEIFQTVPANLVGVILNGSDSTLVQNYSYYHY